MQYLDRNDVAILSLLEAQHVGAAHRKGLC